VGFKPDRFDFRPFHRFSAELPASVICLSNPPGIGSVMSYDPVTIATLRRALDEVLFDERFYRRKSASALEVAEHLLAQAAAGERNLEKLKASAFEKLFGEKQRLPDRAA
jgi:hypothetical protein